MYHVPIHLCHLCSSTEDRGGGQVLGLGVWHAVCNKYLYLILRPKHLLSYVLRITVLRAEVTILRPKNGSKHVNILDNSKHVSMLHVLFILHELVPKNILEHSR